ncbi:MAG: hypothetical protein KKF48_03025 [Nanoarchaeota archaeon]|nr:hypothetical protein [Nanoarchaeota archaeon]MBU1027996.1 hypothetical protein [Nanoarchaeota archaeon]
MDIKKSSSGRDKIKVIESVPYSQLIFLISSGKTYALEIAKARGKKDSSPTAKQLDQLKKRGFLTSKKGGLLNKNIYSINWKKINKEFVNYVFNIFEKDVKDYKKISKKEQDEPKENHYNELLKKIKTKNFDKDIKNHEYLITLLKLTFPLVENREKTIREIFEDLRINFPQPPGTFVDHPSKFHDEKKRRESGEYYTDLIEGRKRDEKYAQLEEFIKITRGVSDTVGMRGIERLWKYLQIKYTASHPNNEIRKELLQTVPKEVMEIIKENCFKGTKPTENKEEDSENANQNVVLSTEKGEIENEK